MGPPPKKRKIAKKGEEIIMIPVAADDFKKMNEFAEAAMIVRNPDRAEEIKETRRRLLQQVGVDKLFGALGVYLRQYKIDKGKVDFALGATCQNR